MSGRHPLLLRQLKRVGLVQDGQLPDAEQWQRFLDRVDRVYTEADQERYLIERSQRISSREMQELYSRLEEAQRIAGLGYWSFNSWSQEALWSDECFRILGMIPTSRPLSYRGLLRCLHREDHPRVREKVRAAGLQGQDFELEFRLALPGGTIRWVRVVGKTAADDSGQVVRVHGTVVNITGRKQVELRQTMEHTVTRLLAENRSPTLAMPRILRVICDTLGWVCGAMWSMDRQQSSLQRQAFWALPEAAALQDFFQETPERLRLPPADGLLGRALQTGKPVWMSDVSQDGYFPRAAAAGRAGLRAAFAFPIEAGGKVLGAMEFFSCQAQLADMEMLGSAHFIGRHIGQFLQRQQAQTALKESEAHFRALVEQASDSFYVHDFSGRFIDVNQRACDSLGYSRSELLALRLSDIDVDLPLQAQQHLLSCASERTPLALESHYRRKDGSVFPVEIRVAPIEIEGQLHLLSLVRDVTERKQLQDHIQHLAYHDPLTDLPNRTMFNRHLSHALVKARRYSRSLALLFIDLDRFKTVNDTLGHAAGDRLLQEVARRLTQTLGKDDIVARLGGDEFVVLLEEVIDPAAVSHVARQILLELVREYPLDDQLLHVTASIGISLFPQDGANEFLLMKHADIAMYRAKERGKNIFQFYSEQMDVDTAALLELESGLRHAIERGELELHYQPKVHTASGRITGAEALLRWRHPRRGLLQPEQFIPLAEETGLIVPLTLWVLRQACQQKRLWHEQGLTPVRIAVNLSARQFSDDQLLDDVARILEEAGMPPASLELEITESMMMQDVNRTVQVLSGLKQMGVMIALDDFGIGYSSLSQLKQFPIDIIKIDRSFITDIPGQPADEAIADAIIAMSKSLKKLVIAEGVETQAQLEFLRQRGCHEIQGYFFSRPLPAEKFSRLLRQDNWGQVCLA